MLKIERVEEWDALIEYLDRVCPGFRSKRQPATQSQIAEYEATIGQPIYPAFRQYLERIGAEDGGIFASAGYSVAIDDLIYDAVDARDVDCGPEFVQEYLTIGSSDAVWYGLRVSGEYAGRVVRLHECKEDDRYTPHIADSLIGYVFGYGITQEMRQLGTQWAGVTAAGGLRSAIIDHFANTIETERYSDSVRWYGRGQNMLVGIWYYPSTITKLDIRITARSAETSMRAAEALASKFQLGTPQLHEHGR